MLQLCHSALCNGIHWIRKQFNSRKPKSFLGKDTLGHSGRLVGTVDGWARWHIAVGSGKHEAWKVQQVEQGNGKVQDEFEILMTFASRKQGQVLWFKNIIWNKLMFMHNCTQLEKNGIAHKTLCHRDGFNPSSPLPLIFLHERSWVSLICWEMVVLQLSV